MEAQTEYGQALTALKQVKFDGESPWDSWTPQNLAAIRAMFGNSNGTEGGDETDNADRQSNVAGGRMLFALSQSSLNPYRYSRMQAQNGESYVPVVPLSLINDHMSATVGAFINHIRTHVLNLPTGWAAFNGIALMNLWRMAPHQNWSGTLPERLISGGEALWYAGNRLLRAYSMNEWQVRDAMNQYACQFSSKLVTDVGAIRFVSVTGRRTLTATNVSYVVGAGIGVANQDPGFKSKVDEDPQTKHSLKKLYDAAGGVYDGSRGIKPQESTSYSGTTKKRPFGLPPNTKSRANAFTVDLHERKPIRFYFSLNHYRSICFNVKGQQVSLNPWFAIID